MYESFFQLDERPFNALPLAHRYYPAAAIEDARRRLTRSIERFEGPGLVIGPTGTGKSLLLHVLAEQFRATRAIAHLTSGRLCTRRTLLQAILYELGLPYRDLQEGELRLSLIDHLVPEGPCPGGMLLLVDEAHALPLALLEELRMITDLVRDGQPRAGLVLAGSTALEESFANPKLESFNQRLAARCYLEPLDHNDSVQYVRAQIAASGGDPERIFTAEALDTVHRATDGIPRLINQLCDHALVMASAGGVEQLSPANIEEAWADLQQLPTPWSASDTTAGAQTETDVVEFGALDDQVSTDPADAPEEVLEAVPFSAGTTGDDVGHEPDERLAATTRQPSEPFEPFEPAGSIGPEVALVDHDAHDPFAESFDEEEEVVIDQCASLDEGFSGVLQRVHSFEGYEISAALQQAIEPNSEMSPLRAADQCDDAAALARAPEYDPVMPEDGFSPPAVQVSPTRADFDVVAAEEGVVAAEEHELIIIEDEAAAPPAAPVKVHRQNYRQLFAKLRHG